MTITQLCWTLFFVAGILASRLAAQEKAGAKGGAKPPAKASAKGDKASAEKATDEKPSAKKTSDEDKSDTSPSVASKSDDPAVMDFDKVFAEWRELLSTLKDLQAKYLVTPRKGGLRAPIKQEFDDLVKEGEKLEPKVIAAAEAAFAVVGDARPEIGKYLASHLKYDVEQDDYEPAVGIARTLIDNGYDNPRIYNLGGIAAFCTNQFDDAEKWLKEGDKHSVLEVDAKQFLSYIKQYKDMWQTEQELREAEAKADLPRVLLKTTHGDIVVELFENEAPNTVANFISLVEKPFYDGVKFHRVLPHFMAQGGDPNGDGTGGPGYNIPDETDRSDYRNHFRGSLSMAKTNAPDSGGSQFFLMFRPSGPAAGFNLNGKHTVFGRVIDGLDVLARIQRMDPDKPEPGVQADKIIEAKVLRKRKHAYFPKKAGEESAEKTDDKKTDDKKDGDKGDKKEKEE